MNDHHFNGGLSKPNNSIIELPQEFYVILGGHFKYGMRLPLYSFMEHLLELCGIFFLAK